MHQLPCGTVKAQQLVAGGGIGWQGRHQHLACVLHAQALGACRVLDHEIAAGRHGDAHIGGVRCGAEDACTETDAPEETGVDAGGARVHGSESAWMTARRKLAPGLLAPVSKEGGVGQGDENCKGQEIVAGRPMLVSGVSTSGKTVWGEDEAMQAPVE
jgi:hypothetical protein